LLIFEGTLPVGIFSKEQAGVMLQPSVGVMLHPKTFSTFFVFFVFLFFFFWQFRGFDENEVARGIGCCRGQNSSVCAQMRGLGLSLSDEMAFRTQQPTSADGVEDFGGFGRGAFTKKTSRLRVIVQD
jgi:hypothetical protein